MPRNSWNSARTRRKSSRSYQAFLESERSSGSRLAKATSRQIEARRTSMTASLRTVIVDSDADSVAALKRILAASPSVVLVGEFVNSRQAAHEAPARRPDLVIVEVDEAGPTSVAEQPAWVIGSLTRALPGAAIFATGQSTSADFVIEVIRAGALEFIRRPVERDRKSTRLNSSHLGISYAVFCLKKKTRVHR